MLSKGWIVFLILAAVLVLLWIASELVIPNVAERYVEREIEKRYPDAEEVSVSIRSFPAFTLLFKRYSRLKVGAKGITLEGVHFDSIELESEKWPLARFNATISESEINRVFSPSAPYLKNPRLELGQDTVSISGDVELGTAGFEATASGTLEAVDGRDIYFEPLSIEVPADGLPERVIEEVEEQMEIVPLYVVRDDLPFVVSGIGVERGKLLFEGEVDLEESLKIL